MKRNHRLKKRNSHVGAITIALGCREAGAVPRRNSDSEAIRNCIETQRTTAHVRQPFNRREGLDYTWKRNVPQSEYPLNVGKSAVPVEVPVTPRLTPEVVEDTPVFDEGGLVDDEEGIDELTPV